MGHPVAKPLADLVTALALDVTRTQRVLDDRYADDAAIFEHMVRHTPPAARPFLAPLAPARQLITRQEVNCRVGVRVEKSIGVGVNAGVYALPLNLGFDLRYGTARGRDSRLTVVVEQVPPANAPAPGGETPA